ncbi:transcriptional regulator [Archaeoglobales archaeon]|nr:MAG: transcriptional regulator [Archaeoglobales archaeon]
MELDDDIVNPKRILIMTTLFIFREMTEGDLAKATGIGWGSLSTHVARLEKKGYLERKKVITNKGVRTIVKITEKGYQKYRDEVEKLKEVIVKVETVGKDKRL